MEKGNTASSGAGAAISSGRSATGGAAPETSEGDVLVNPAPSSSSGGGPNINATEPRIPTGRITNPDGTYRTISRDMWGNDLIEDFDADGNLVDTNVRDPSGAADYAKSDRPDGTSVEKWSHGEGQQSTRTTAKDGSSVEVSEYPEGSSTTTTSADGLRSDFVASDGRTGFQVQDPVTGDYAYEVRDADGNVTEAMSWNSTTSTMSQTSGGTTSTYQVDANGAPIQGPSS